MGHTLEDELFERLKNVELDATLQVSSSATIGARSQLNSGLAPTVAAAATDSQSSATTAPTSSRAQSLPRISLGAIGSSDREGADARPRPDLVFEKILGEGGMGRVHLASQHSLRRHVAVKTLKEGATRDAHDALLSEARVTGFLAHPGIIPVHSLGLDDHDHPVLVMKCVEGVPWRDLLTDPTNATWAHWEARIGDRLHVHLEILTKICDAVHFAHNQGVVHRDIKPDNVMLGRFGEVYLVDWGLAIEIAGDQRAQLVGTPAYMAPEMALGQSVEARTDVYLLGACLYEVLTGEHLHRGDTLHDLLLHASRSEPCAFSSAVPAELAALCRAATSKDIADRPTDAESFRHGISEFLAHRSSIAVSDAAQLRMVKGEHALADTSMGAPERAYILGTHCAEARFGFEQAIEAWPRNDAAQEALRRCRELLVESHILRRDPVGALAELQSLQPQPPALLAKVEELQNELDREHRDQERLKKIDLDADATMGFRERMWAYFITLAGIAGITLYSYLHGKLSSIKNSDTVVVASLFLTVALLVLAVNRKKLLGNAFTRRSVYLVFIALGSIFLNRLLAWRLGTPMQSVFITDLIVAAACATLGAISLKRWIFWVVPFLVIGAVTIAFAPAKDIVLLFTGSMVASLLTGGAAWLVQRRGEARA